MDTLKAQMNASASDNDANLNLTTIHREPGPGAAISRGGHAAACFCGERI